MYLLLLTLVGYTTETEMVPMRDSIHLRTICYLPDDTTWFPLPAIMMRTPYGADNAYSPAEKILWTDMLGYVLVAQDMRGRFGSEGEDSIFLDDGWRDGKWDGYDAVEWLTRQPWCNGRVGTVGASAGAITQYLLTGAKHPNHVCGWAQVGATDLFRHAAFPGGVYREYDIDGWSRGHGLWEMREYYTQHPVSDTAWQYGRLATRRDSARTALFHAGGWYDIFTDGPVEGYQLLRHLGNQRLLMGPWGHYLNMDSIGQIRFPHGRFDSFSLWIQRWAHYWLKDSGSIDHIPQVSYYRMGPKDVTGDWNRWCSSDNWPPSDDSLTLFLRAGGGLAFSAPAGAEPADTFVYDPHNPVPTVGGNNMILPYGPRDQSSVWNRPDVLRYVSEPLVQDVLIEGRIRAVLWAGSDRLDTDWAAKLVDVYPDGRKMIIRDGSLMARYRLGLDREALLTPGESYEFNVDVGNTAYCIPAGHQVGLAVSSSNSPRLRVNLNNGGHPFRDTTDTLVATNVVLHDDARASRIVLQGRVLGAVSEAPGRVRRPAARTRGVEVFDINGRRLRGSPTALPAGCYLVRRNGVTAKVVVIRN